MGGPKVGEGPGEGRRARAGRGWAGRAARWWARRRADLAAATVYVALAVLVTSGLWLSGGSAATADNTRDHAQFLFFFQHAAHSVVHLDNPLFTSVLGWPYGVNLMANTAFLGMAVPLIPVTLTLGAGVSYALALTIALAGTAFAWYVVLRWHVTRSRGVAFAAGALAGFSPGMVGHGNGHPNISAQFLLPFIVSAVVRLPGTPPGRARGIPVRSGIVLGLLIAGQVFLNEELLLFTVIACLLMAVVFAISRPALARAGARRFLGGVGVAFGVAAALTAYPLWFQFLGPQHYHGPFTWAPFYWTDVAAYPAYGANSIAGRLGSASLLNGDPAETNAFPGLPLVAFTLVGAVALWRVLAVRIAAVVAVVFLLLSFGDPIRVLGTETHIPGPWRLFANLPIFDAVITPRLALVVVPAMAVIVAAAGDRLLSLAGERPRSPAGDPSPDGSGSSPAGDPAPGAAGRRRAAGDGQRRVLVWGLLAAVLVPLIPTPLRTTEPEPVPAFITAGTWRQYVRSGTLVPVPPDPYSEATLRWLVAGDMAPRYVDGYFLGPTGPGNPVARYGPPDRPTGLLLGRVAETGEIPAITPALRALARDDLRYWHADVLVLAPRANSDALRSTVDELVGSDGQFVDGVWVWDVRAR